MGKSKPKWSRSKLPLEVKVKLWGIMRKNRSLPAVQKFLGNNSAFLTEYEWEYLGVDKGFKVRNKQNEKVLLSRDTYNVLREEIKAMPLRELVLLPEGIQYFGRELRGDTKLTLSTAELIKQQEEHIDDLTNAASTEKEVKNLQSTYENNWPDHYNKLAEILHNLLVSLISARDSETHKDVMLGNLVLTDGQQDGNEYINDQPERLLLEHLKFEIPELQKFERILELTAVDLTDDLLDKLTTIDVRKTFKGKCQICKDWE